MKKSLAFLAVVLLPLAANAQVPVEPHVGGITVSGYGAVRVAVKTVLVTAQARGFPDESGLLVAMRAAGLDDMQLGSSGPQMYGTITLTQLRGTIHDVTRAKLDRLREAITTYVRGHLGSGLDNLNFVASVDDCATPENGARGLALADAKRKADSIAAHAAVSVGDVVAITEGGGCLVADPSYGGPGQFDVATLTSTVAVLESVTYAIVPGTPSARRRTL